MFLAKIQDSLEWTLLVVLVLGGGAIAQAQNRNDPTHGKIVPITPGGESATIVADEAKGADADVADGQIQLDAPHQPAPPKHWIGILGGPMTDELRAQTDVPEGQGVLVRHVAPGSPADEAGLKVFDILLRANDADLTDIGELSELVKSQGESGGKITLDVLRRGQYATIVITPATRPEPAAGQSNDQGSGWVDEGFGFGEGVLPPEQQRELRRLLGQLYQGQLHRGGLGGGQLAPRGPRMLSPRSGLDLGQMPNGVSASIQKQNDEPARITVRRGNDTWEIIGDDPRSLAALPDDLRPFVEQLVAGGGSLQMPTMSRMPALPRPPVGFGDDAMQQRLQRMEKELQNMRLMLEQGLELPRADEQAETNQEPRISFSWLQKPKINQWSIGLSWL